VTSIGNSAFNGCSNLISVTIGIIDSAYFGTTTPFPGNLRTVYFASGGGAGTYTRASSSSTSWTKN